MKHLFLLSSLLVMALGWAATPVAGQATADRARVTGVLGPVSVALGGAAPQPVQKGLGLSDGMVVRTGPRAAVDLEFAGNAGLVRLTENSVLVLEKLVNVAPGSQAAMVLQLNLFSGSLVGRAGQIAPTAAYEVKIPHGIAAIDHGFFRISAQGFIVLVDGALAFAHAPAGSEPVAYPLKAPPEVYFSPIEKVKPAPEALVREVQNQLKAPLPGRARAKEEVPDGPVAPDPGLPPRRRGI